jgi:hypothetical protein
MIRISLCSNWQELLVDPSGPLLKLSITKLAEYVGIIMVP